MKLILATFTAGHRIVKKDGRGHEIASVVIKGGANVMDKRLLDTPHGVVTEVTDDEYAWVKETDVWKRWVADGYVKVVASKGAAENVEAEGLNDGDASKQLTADDLTGTVSADGIEAPKSEATATATGRRGRKAKGV